VFVAHHVPGFLPRRTLPILLFSLIAATAGCVEGEQSAVRVASLKFTGVNAVTPGQLKDALATVQSSKLPWGDKHYFSREDFDADLKRIVAFYRDRGFPDAKVRSFDVKMNDKQDAVDVTLHIEEGQPIVVEALEYQGFEVLPAGELDELKGRLALKANAPLDRARAQASREAALDEVKDHGYPYATVRLTERPGSHERARIITVATTPGTLARYGEIDVQGNTSVSDNVVVRQLTFRPNRRFRLSQLQESQRRLYSLETFQFANVEPVIVEGQQPDIVPVKVTVTEGKHRKVNFGLGYGSEEKARGSIDWRHVNFFGGARTLQLEGGYSARLNFRQPYVFGPRYNLVTSAQSWHRNEPAYDLVTRGGRVTLERTFARRGPLSQRQGMMALSLSYTNEFQSYEVTQEALDTPEFLETLIALGFDPLSGRGRGRMSSVELDFHRATTDSTINARRGYMFDAHFERAGGFLQGDFEFFETILEGRSYFSLGDFGVVALKARGGSIGKADGPNLAVPFHRRYFLGGAQSLRGWGRFEVSPLFDGVMVGGHTMFESSAEFRVPVWRSLSAVLFADAGNVWNNAWDFDLSDMRYDVGPGLRYLTPIGPIRVDLGYQLNPIEGLLVDGKPQTRRFRIHFSIGQAF
jgi:outer membrane protein assembly complex protein YaeT